MPVPQPIPVPGGMPVQHAVVTPLPARQPSARVLEPVPERRETAQPDAMPMGQHEVDAMVATDARHAHGHAPHGPRPVPRTGSPLFVDAATRPATMPPTPPPSMEPSKPSLFSQVTGVFRRRQMGFGGDTAALPQSAPLAQQRAEPRQPQPMSAATVSTATPEEQIEIPAFLRRQSS